MLNYKANESKKSSHFHLNTSKESIYLLLFKNIDEEDQCFEDSYLQENLVEMKIVRVTQQREYYCTALAYTIKSLFDRLLFKYEDFIIYASVPLGSMKEKLIWRFIEGDENDEFHYFDFKIDGYRWFFFCNETKTNSIYFLNSITSYLKREFGVTFEFDTKEN
jgi:hypothetical protein